MSRPIAVVPATRPEMHQAMCEAVSTGGARLSNIEEAEGVVWADPSQPQLFPEIIETAHNLEWIQLPYAGIEPFVEYLDAKWTWTCGKGVYAPAVAETVIAMALALFKNLHTYSRTTTWSNPTGQYLSGARVTILGGGGIAESLLELLKPFNCYTTVIRRKAQPLPLANQTTTLKDFEKILPNTDLLVVALSLTPATTGIIDKNILSLLPNTAYLINVARGGHLVTNDLLSALENGTIQGAAIDVTDPEPLPDDHPLWKEPRCLITPHTANTPEMGLNLLVPFVAENVRRFINRQSLLASVDIELGY